LNHSSHDDHSDYLPESLVKSIEGGQLKEAIYKMNKLREEMKEEKE
jgi:hypothetical protein